MKRWACVLLLSAAVVFGGCSGSKMTILQGRPPTHAVTAIAMAPSGGVLSDAIAVELFNMGFQIVDTAETSNLLLRLGLSELEVSQPENLRRLHDEGVDAYLSVRSVAGQDGAPQSATVRVNSTHDGSILAGLSWQNGWGGMAGSMADRTMRKDLVEAATEIAHELAKRLGAS